MRLLQSSMADVHTDVVCTLPVDLHPTVPLSPSPTPTLSVALSAHPWLSSLTRTFPPVEPYVLHCYFAMHPVRYARPVVDDRQVDVVLPQQLEHAAAGVQAADARRDVQQQLRRI